MKSETKYFLCLMLLVLLTFWGISAFGKERVVTYQTLPNSTVRDYRAPAYITTTDKKGNVETFQTLPSSTVRDYTKPSYRKEVKK